MAKTELELYDYASWEDRPQIVWPGGAKLAFWVAPNIEFYELDPPAILIASPGRIHFQPCRAIASATTAIG